MGTFSPNFLGQKAAPNYEGKAPYELFVIPVCNLLILFSKIFNMLH